MKVAIVGATGLVGNVMLKVLEERNFPVDELLLVASERSVGKKIKFKGEDITVISIPSAIEKRPDIALFSAGGETSLEWAPKFAASGTTVIDNSSAFRMNPVNKLVVPEINASELTKEDKIIANPNCSTAQLVIALKPLHDLFNIERIVVSTYQSVSGGGKAPMDELIDQTKLFLENKSIKSKNFTKQIAFNAIPHIDHFTDDGYTKEELKMTNETKKILDKNIELTATCVRIPVLVSHGESVNVQFKKSFTLEKINEALNKADGCEIYDSREDGGYSTPIEAAGKNETFISRIREDKTNKNTINLWIVSDNLLRGAALNSVEIAETIIKYNLHGK